MFSHPFMLKFMVLHLCLPQHLQSPSFVTLFFIASQIENNLNNVVRNNQIPSEQKANLKFLFKLRTCLGLSDMSAFSTEWVYCFLTGRSTYDTQVFIQSFMNKLNNSYIHKMVHQIQVAHQRKYKAYGLSLQRICHLTRKHTHTQVKEE